MLLLWCVIYTGKKLFYSFTSFQTFASNTVKFKTNSFFYFRIGKLKFNKANRDYCRRYREKNKDAIKKKEREYKKMSRDYEKYLNTEKYQQRPHKDRIWSREYLDCLNGGFELLCNGRVSQFFFVTFCI